MRPAPIFVNEYFNTVQDAFCCLSVSALWHQDHGGRNPQLTFFPDISTNRCLSKSLQTTIRGNMRRKIVAFGPSKNKKLGPTRWRSFLQVIFGGPPPQAGRQAGRHDRTSSARPYRRYHYQTTTLALNLSLNRSPSCLRWRVHQK